VTHVVVKNLQDKPWQGTVRLELPDGWAANRGEAEVRLEPGETKRVPFAIQKALNAESNRYVLRIAATGGGHTVAREQTVVCASAPYFRPKIDGRPDEWGDAIPISFICGGKRTTVRTYWNRRHFCLLAEVEEEDLRGYRSKPGEKGFDAVQFALAPAEAVTGTTAEAEAVRYEFLLAAGRGWWHSDKCFLLLKSGDPLATARQPTGLAEKRLKGADVRVRRRKGITCYECAVPWAAMPAIRPMVGRELRFSFLVHDPDGTGIRDWGEAAGLWPWQRSKLAWCMWPGARWNEEPPFDGKIEFGLCTSRH
jgi:hypothetical protein